MRVFAVRRFLFDSAFAFTFEPLFTHDARHNWFAARFVFLKQAGVNSSSTVGVAAVLVNAFDLLAQVLPLFGPAGFFPFSPFVVPAFADLEHSEHDLEIEFLAVFADEFEFQRLSLAKKVTAFFRMSRS